MTRIKRIGTGSAQVKGKDFVWLFMHFFAGMRYCVKDCSGNPPPPLCGDWNGKPDGACSLRRHAQKFHDIILLDVCMSTIMAAFFRFS